MALTATVGSASANSYVTVAEATAYFANRLWAEAWDDVENAEQALITASLRLDQESFHGYRASETQALKWPRIGVYTDGVLIASDSIPQKLKDAVCELALSLASSNVLEQSELANFKSIDVGPISLEMNQPVTSGTLPAQVIRLLGELRVGTSGAQILRA